MTKKANILLVSALALSLSLSSCDVMTAALGTSKKSQGTTEAITIVGSEGGNVDTPAQKIANPTEAETPASSSSQEKPKTPPDTSAEKQAPAKTTPAAPSHNTVESALTGLVDGEWTIVQVGNAKINIDDMPYIVFSESDNRFYASNGCNILNGCFSFDGTKGIIFDNVLSTMKACPDNKYEKAINGVLADGKKVTADLKHEGSETYLTLRDTNGKAVMIVRKHNMERLNGQWNVEKIEGEMIKSEELNIFLDIPELKVHGNTGCNYFNGEIIINSSVPNSISFSNMAVTMKLCPNADLERKMLVALEETTSYKMKSNEYLILLNDSGHPVMTLKK